jgi:Family of unknown function (DUF6134)
MTRLLFGVLFGVLVLLGASASRALAGDSETRDFSVSVDGKPAGEYHATIARQEDGSVTLDAHSSVKVKFLLITAYSYDYNAQEVWKNGRLQSLESHGKEDSKPFRVSARADGDVIRVKANGHERTVPAECWCTSCWQLPATRKGAVTLLSCDNGEQVQGIIQFIGAETITVAGQEMTCNHYRVMKPVTHDIWYDSSDRVVRDTWITEGHKSEIVLTGIRR